ncbi:MAG: hypothetical protein WBH50_23785 [Fuerstiella sp.]
MKIFCCLHLRTSTNSSCRQLWDVSLGVSFDSDIYHAEAIPDSGEIDFEIDEAIVEVGLSSGTKELPRNYIQICES